jgi:phosphocarrier protein HPr
MSDDSAEGTFEIVNDLGLHARAASRFVQVANGFKSDVQVEKDGQTVNGKSIMGVLMLVASKGTSIKVRTKGGDAPAALDALRVLTADGFGEGKGK